MGSPLSPIVTNLYMEKFEQKAIDPCSLKPRRRKSYVDDTNVKWQHGKEELNGFLERLNGISNDIKFTMELEDNNCIPFPNILITRNEDGPLGHQVFKKKTHSVNYLHANTHHYLTHKFGIRSP